MLLGGGRKLDRRAISGPLSFYGSLSRGRLRESLPCLGPLLPRRGQKPSGAKTAKTAAKLCV